jgi:hypothetical protein
MHFRGMLLHPAIIRGWKRSNSLQNPIGIAKA